jgi:amidase
MDLPDMGPNSITNLPVRTAGARLFIGDAHACQGDGRYAAPRSNIPSPPRFGSMSSKGGPWNGHGWSVKISSWQSGARVRWKDATRIACRELVLWMEAEYGFGRWDAYMMLSQYGRVRLGNFVDPRYTVGAGISKSWLAA